MNQRSEAEHVVAARLVVTDPDDPARQAQAFVVAFQTELFALESALRHDDECRRRGTSDDTGWKTKETP